MTTAEFGPGKRHPLMDRFIDKVEMLPDVPGCWLWTGSSTLHTTCDLPCCVNPWHMTLGTQLDNLAEMRSKNRGRKSHSGLPYGVYFDARRGRYGARISRRPKCLWLGYYNNESDAATAVNSALLALSN